MNDYVNNDVLIKKAVILASGYGRRLRLKEKFPSKPMTPICNKPLISYVIDMMLYSGIEKIYIVCHAVTSDVRELVKYSADYAEHLEFIEEDEQKGTLLSFSRVKDILFPPFLMVFEDIMADKDDFKNMLNIGQKYIASATDLVIQTVSKPSINSEQAFLIENGRIVMYQKNGITIEKRDVQKKYGGMVYLWLSTPFPLMEQYLAEHNYKFSAFLEYYIQQHVVSEMPICDMWDIDTPEAVEATNEILKRRGGWNGRIKQY